jgi:hypothetical protein
VIFNASSFAYSIFQYIQLFDSVTGQTFGPDFRSIHVCLLIIILILGFSEIFYVFLGYKLYLEFGWKIYKKIGADPRMRSKIL